YPEPVETYHTSDHLYADLDIPSDITGTLPVEKRTREGLSAEKLEDLGETGKSAGRNQSRSRGGGRSGGRGGRGGQGGQDRRGNSRGSQNRGDSHKSRDTHKSEENVNRQASPRRNRKRRRVNRPQGEES
ncbi:MAG: DEAD/DEAH box helicase, partial [Ancrocorticia sp.]